MRRYLALLALLVVPCVLGQALNPKTGVLRRTDCTALTCNSGRNGTVCIDQDNGQIYACNGTSWVIALYSGATYDADGDGTVDTADGLTCTDCVTLSTETSGNYAAGDAESGDALAVDVGQNDIEVRANATLALRAANGIKLSPGGAYDVTVGADGALLAHALGLGDTLRLGLTTWALNNYGAFSDKVPFIDRNGDGDWDPRAETLLVPPRFVIDDRYDCDSEYVDPTRTCWNSSGIGTPTACQAPYGYVSTVIDGYTEAKAQGACRMTNPLVASGFSALRVGNGSGAYPARDIVAVSKLRLFAARVTGRSTSTAQAHHWVGGIRRQGSGTGYNSAQINSIVGFMCAPGWDLDGDGTATDGAEDDNWWWVAMNDQSATCSGGTCYGCQQLADGDANHLYDCDVDGTADFPVGDAVWTAGDTGYNCDTNNQYREFEVTFDGTLLRFYAEGTLVGTAGGNMIPSYVAMWGVLTGSAAPASTQPELWVDYARYMGVQ